MVDKKNLRDLGFEELEAISKDTPRLREVCSDYNTTVLKFYKTLRELETDSTNNQGAVKETRRRRKRKSRRRTASYKKQAPKNAEDIVIYAFRDFSQRIERGTQADYQGLISEVKVDLEKTGFEIDKRCQIEGFVASVLYGLAESSAHTDDKESSARYVGMIERPIDSSDLEKILKVKFSDEIFNQIAGKLNSEYLRRHYVFDSLTGSIKLKNEDGDLISDPNIEGTICFNGNEKRDTREFITNFVTTYLAKQMLKKAERFDAEINQIEADRESKQRTIGRIEEESRKK
jgi:hypothetical protein